MHFLRRVAEFLRPVFALDLRSLAAFRIGVATVLLVDLFWRLGDVSAFLTDEGVLSRTLRLEMTIPNDPNGHDYQWSLHLLSGHAWSQYVLMAVAAWFAGWLLVGYRTRLAAVLSWVLLVSIGNRNPLIYDGGDAVLRSLLFWALFLPLGARFSFDEQRTRKRAGINGEPIQPPTAPSSVVSFASAAFMLQLLVVYFGAAMFKMNHVWLREFSGVYYALNCDPFATRLGLFVRNFPSVMRILTAITMLVELCGPFMVLLPFWNRWLRVVVVISFCMMHLGMAATMTLGIFPWVCISAWLAFLPDVVWDRGWVRIRRGFEKQWPSWFVRDETQYTPVECGTADSELKGNHRLERYATVRAMPRVAGHVLVAGLLVYAILWNLRDVADEKNAHRILPDRMNRLAQVLGLEKGWCMFAPVPRPDDGWPIFKGVLRDGSEVNLWQPDQPIPWTKPPVVSAMYLNQRWRRYLENMTMENYTLYRPYFSDWLQQRWDRNYARGNPAREVVTVEMLRQLETTPPPGEPIPAPETMELWTKHYGQSIKELGATD